MIDRIASAKIKQLSSLFKAVAVTGPRQSGKTTLVKELFQDKPYVSLENPDNRKFALEDPRGFLERYPVGQFLMRSNEHQKSFPIYRKFWIAKEHPGNLY
jgi:predicted AAA+ superfamily ATPase